MVDNLFNPERARADRGQLDCKRHPVQLATQLDNGSVIVSGKVELPACGYRPVTEKSDRFELAQLLDRRSCVGLRKSERWYGMDKLSVDVERLAACGQDSDAWRPVENPTHHGRARIQQMFAVVDNEEQFLVNQVFDKRQNRRLTRLVAQAQRGQGGRRNQACIPNLLKVDEPYAVRKCSRQLTPGMQCQPRLADPAGASEREQARVSERGPDGSELVASSNEARQLRWQVSSCRACRDLCHRGTVSRVVSLEVMFAHEYVVDRYSHR